METFEDYFNTIEDVTARGQLEEVTDWIDQHYPELDGMIKWNTLMYVFKDTFILGISSSRKHMSISPEEKTMSLYKEDIDQAGYSQTKGLFRIKYSDEVNYELLKKLIEFNIEDKKDYENFWR